MIFVLFEFIKSFAPEVAGSESSILSIVIKPRVEKRKKENING